MTIPHAREVIEKYGFRDVLRSMTYPSSSANLKIDQMSLNMKITEDGPVFVKRDGKTPVTLLDMVFNSNYEEPIAHLTKKFQECKLGNSFGGFTLFMEYFPEKPLPTYIQYDYIPKNRLVLSYVKSPEEILSPSHHSNFCSYIADKLDIDPPPVLSDKYIILADFIELFDYAIFGEKRQSNLFSILSRFGVFSRIPSREEEELCEKFCPDNKIEGIVCFPHNFPRDPVQIPIFKIVDLNYTRWRKERETCKESQETDLYSRTLSNIIFPFLLRIEDRVHTDTSSTNLLEFIESLLDIFPLQEIEKRVDPFKESALNSRFSDVNAEVFKEETRKKLETYWFLCDLLRILLFLLSKERKQNSTKLGIDTDRKILLNRVVKTLKEKRLI